MSSDTIEPARGAPASDGAPKSAGGEAGSASLTQAVRWRVPVLSAPRPASQSRNPSLPTFVGLIILILTFFIVLTSLSLHDQRKSEAAIASLQDAFSGNAVTDEDVPAKKDEEIADDYIAGLTHRIQSLVPLMGGKPAPASDHQVLWLPVDLAFAAESVTPAPLFPTVLREVVNSLDGIPQRLTPHIEMRLCATGPSDQLRGRAVAIGTALAGEHAPMGQFSIGVASCDPKRIGIAIALAPAAEESTPAADGETANGETAGEQAP
ncbi:MAG TPA: flagellar motor protein MotB [Dongiaceae bacterium]|nr:flagellar motor protein MotB [Dongiaceae bacterium]